MKLKLFSGTLEIIEKQFAEWQAKEGDIEILDMCLATAVAVLPIHQASSVVIPGLPQAGVSVMNAQVIVLSVLYNSEPQP